MAPLTLAEKYDDLVRCADQPLTSYDKLSNEDFEDVISKRWPFIIESIMYTPLSGEIRTRLERRLKIHFQLYSEAAKRHQQKFPNRKPSRSTRNYISNSMTDARSLSLETTSTFSFNNTLNMNVPDFYVFCSPDLPDGQLSSATAIRQRSLDFRRVKEYLMATESTSPYKTLVFKQAIKECCRYGNYYFLDNLCSAVDMCLENIYFDNNDTILHEAIKFNNKQLTSELIRHKFNINADGELGTPLVTAIHYNLLWAVEMLLKNEADLTKRHIDWPFLTLEEYCIQFAKIDIKLIIDKHIASLNRKRNYKHCGKIV